MYTGPNIIKDNLVFGYDTGYGIADNETTTRFYPGEPTTNEFYGSGSNGNILDHASGYGGYGTAQTGALDAFGTTENTVYRNTGKMRLGPTGGQDIGTLTNGNTYTFSIYLRHVTGENNVPGSNGFEFDIVDNAGGATYDFSGNVASNMTYDWKRFAVTSTHSNNANYRFLDVGTYQGTNVWEWCMPQIEVGSHATPYTRTSRSSTASLIDLKTTSDINLSNVSFHSTGQPTFDGSDDYINIGSSAVLDVGSMTQEVIYQPLGINRRNPIIADNNPNGSDKTHAMWLEHYNNNKLLTIFGDGSTHGDVYSTATITDTTKYHHVVCVRDATAKTMEYFINGVSDGVKDWANKSTIGTPVVYDGSTSALSYDHTIGGHSSFSKSYSNIPVVKIYNRKLTSAEVKQNYNAYKNRFGI